MSHKASCCVEYMYTYMFTNTDLKNVIYSTAHPHVVHRMWVMPNYE